MKKVGIYFLLLTYTIFSAFCNDFEVLVTGNNDISSFYMQKFNTTVKEYNEFIDFTGENILC